MKRLIGIAATALTLFLATACGSEPSADTQPAPPPAKAVQLPDPGDVETGPVAIKPSQGTFKYLTRSSDGSYDCEKGMTLVEININENPVVDERGKLTTTKHGGGVEFKLLLSDGYYWLSYPPMGMELRAVIIDKKSGFEMPTFAWHDNPVTKSEDASLHLRDVNDTLTSLALCLAPSV